VGQGAEGGRADWTRWGDSSLGFSPGRVRLVSLACVGCGPRRYRELLEPNSRRHEMGATMLLTRTPNKDGTLRWEAGSPDGP